MRVCQKLTPERRCAQCLWRSCGLDYMSACAVCSSFAFASWKVELGSTFIYLLRYVVQHKTLGTILETNGDAAKCNAAKCNAREFVSLFVTFWIFIVFVLSRSRTFSPHSDFTSFGLAHSVFSDFRPASRSLYLATTIDLRSVTAVGYAIPINLKHE